jgi:phage/plasmid-like protein (TIGR03299 family)
MSHQIMTKDSMLSVRETPWHGLGAVLDDYPEGIEDALQKSGLGWNVRQGDLLVVERPEWKDDFGVLQPAVTRPVEGYRANLREDDGALLGVVSDDYKVVQNVEAFRFLDALIGSDLYFETAGSLMNGKRVWVLVRLPEFMEVGGDETATFVYCANSHDGSMAVTAAVTPVRIVCANTLNYALQKSEARAERTFKFRHTGDLQLKFDEARKVMGMTVNYAEQFKILGDRLAAVRVPVDQAADLARDLFPTTDDLGKIAVRNRAESVERVVSIFSGSTGTEGNAPGTAWTYANAVAEYSDWMRRTTKRTDQVQRSFEDGWLKQRGLDQAMALI